MSIARASALTSSEIEAIVRVVLQRLRDVDARANVGDASVELAVGPRTLRLDQSLVTLEHLRDRWQGLQVLQVPARCVVTPAVVDELRQRDIVLDRRTQAIDASETPTTGTVAVDSAASRLRVLTNARLHAGLTAQLARSGAVLQRLEQDSSEAGLAALRQHVAAGEQYCLWCTARPFAACVAAAREPQITAIQLPQIEDLPRAWEESHPNLIVIDTGRWPLAAISQLVRRWPRSFSPR